MDMMMPMILTILLEFFPVVCYAKGDFLLLFGVLLYFFVQGRKGLFLLKIERLLFNLRGYVILKNYCME